jgi:ribonucleoside-diphosphate reductase alpha chain
LEETVKGNRKIGLGIMGWTDALVKLGLPYQSVEARRMAEKVMKRVRDTAWKTSEKLARERGSFPNFKGSIWEKRGYKRFRNATVTTIAPTGSLSMVAGVSGGIEPLFALSYFRKAMGNYELPELNEALVVAIKRANGVFSPQLIDRIARTGSIQHIEAIPSRIREVFVTAMDIAPEDHVLMQAAFQKYTDNAVSKTINMPATATVEEVMEAVTLAWKTKCKGITVYRDKSRETQVLNVGTQTQAPRYKYQDTNKQSYDQATKNFGGKTTCPNCGGKVMMVEGCETCESCGWGKCSV